MASRKASGVAAQPPCQLRPTPQPTGESDMHKYTQMQHAQATGKHIVHKYVATCNEQ